MKRISLTALAVSALIFVFMSTTQAQTPQDTLNQYISNLQKNPNDIALREKIINLVQEMKPAPAIPEDVDRFEGRAENAAKNAKTAEDFADAAEEYKKALLLAPWLGADYFNLGVMQEKAGKTGDAIESFKLYLLAAPAAPDARDVRKRIAGLEYAAEKAEKKTSESLQKKSGPEAWAGDWYYRHNAHTCGNYAHLQFELQGNEIIVTRVWDEHNWQFGKEYNAGDRVYLTRLKLLGDMNAKGLNTFQDGPWIETWLTCELNSDLNEISCDVFEVWWKDGSAAHKETRTIFHKEWCHRFVGPKGR
jgi:tetratricopeptide (TPR) repeat protein